METKVVRKRRNAPLKSIQNLPASCRKSCHWPLTSNATSPAGPWPYVKLYPVMKRHHPAWTVPCLDHRPASWVVPEAWTEAWVSRRFFFFYGIGWGFFNWQFREERGAAPLYREFEETCTSGTSLQNTSLFGWFCHEGRNLHLSTVSTRI